MIDEPPASSGTGGSGGRVFGIVMVVGALVFGLALGYRLGSQESQVVAIAPTLTPKPTLPPSPTPEPTPTAASFPPPLIQDATVRDELRQAYYAAGAGTSVCEVSGDAPVCHSRPRLVEAPDPSTTLGSFEKLMNYGPIEHLKYGAVVIVEDIQAEQVVAELYTEESFPFAQPIGAAVKDASGVYYIGVNGFDTGRNVVAVRSLSFDRTHDVEGATWHTNIIAFEFAPAPLPSP